MKPQVYIDPRPAELFEKYHKRVRERGPDWVYSLARTVLTPPVWALYRAAPIGTENVPEQGPAILAPNHFSNLDHFFLGIFLYRRVQFMANSQLFRFPLNFILSHGGTFPVRRGKHDQESFITAHTVLGSGGIVGMYGEGGRSRTKKLGHPRPGSIFVAFLEGHGGFGKIIGRGVIHEGEIFRHLLGFGGMIQL